jgi:hypothetical protein
MYNKNYVSAYTDLKLRKKTKLKLNAANRANKPNELTPMHWINFKVFMLQKRFYLTRSLGGINSLTIKYRYP